MVDRNKKYNELVNFIELHKADAEPLRIKNHQNQEL